MLYGFLLGLGCGAIGGLFVAALLAASRRAELEAENCLLQSKADYWRQVALSECLGQIAAEMEGGNEAA